MSPNVQLRKYQQPGRAMEINRELIYVQDRLAEITPEWEAAAQKLEDTDRSAAQGAS